MRFRGFLGVAFVCSISALLPRSADACGGTFCDSGPTAMPVDQTGENIVFVMSDNGVEAHIQIQYQGEADKFAWVIPVQDIPDFEVGSQPLFDALLQASVPRYGYSTTRDMCDNGQNPRANFAAGGPSAGTGGTSSLDNGGPTVVLRKTVGAFEAVVLSGGTAAEVSEWLSTNGYQQSDLAPALLDDYVRAGFVFVAVKLRGGVGVNEIHPLVIRYPNGAPCVPLKLTAVAAVENMGVRTFFLGQGRVVPKTYKHVTLNQARIDWLNFGANYTDVVTHAADSPLADGRAFVTEYAGSSAIVNSSAIYSPTWDASRFEGIEPVDVVSELQTQGLIGYCGGATCTYQHPLIGPLLNQYLPVPASLLEGDFYGCLTCNVQMIDTAAWDAAAFAADFRARIVDPGLHASQLLADNPYLTRMFTTISPAEMIADPEFIERDDLPLVPLPGLATRRIMCNDVNIFTLPDGTTVILPSSSSTWPQISESMSWSATVEEMPEDGAPIMLADHRADIADQIQSYNDAQIGTSSGCACQMPGPASAPGVGAGLALLLGLGFSVRRRRR